MDTKHVIPVWQYMLAVGLIVALAAIGLFVVHETNVQNQDRCGDLRTALKVDHDLIVFATEPASLQGLDATRTAVAQQVNKARADFRAKALLLIPAVSCS